MRKQMRARLRAMAPQEAFGKEAVLAMLSRLPLYAQARYLFGYMSIGCEPDTSAVLSDWLDSDKTVLLPRFDREHERYEMVMVPGLGDEYILSGKFGIREPHGNLPSLQTAALSTSGESFTDSTCLWLVPGLAFSESGARLGRGGGYYDRLLCGAPGRKIGLCLDFQITDGIEVEEHDVPMDYILTPSRVLCCRKA